MTGPWPDLAVVVVNYGSHALLERNLGPWGSPADLRVVVVDNPAPGVDRALVADLAAARGWTLLPQATNIGFGAAVDAGAEHALAHGAGVLVLVNPDLQLDLGTLRALADAARRDPAALLAPRILRPDGSVWFAGGDVLVAAGRTITAGADSTTATGWLTGACLAVSADLWRASGGFDDDYFLYWEDVDLSWRCRAAGGHLVVRDDLAAVHDVGGTQDGAGGGKSPGYVRWNTRNRLLFATRHLPRRRQWAWVLGSAGYARLVLRRAGVPRHIGAHGLPHVLAALRGTAAGVLLVARARSRQRA